MLKIESFLLKRNSTFSKVEQLINNPELYFDNLKDLSSERLIQNVGANPGRIEGSIVISYSGKIFLGFEFWDDIDWLYGFFISALHELYVQEANQATFGFPDQPIDVSLQREGEKIKIQVGHRGITLPAKEVLTSFLEAASYFFQRSATLYQEENFDRSTLNLISELSTSAILNP